MREILFRGKRVDNGEWVEGCYVYDNNLNHHIRAFDNCYYAVIPETVCEWTGLTDKNGKKIFANDKVIYGERIDYDLYKESIANPEEYNGIIFDKGVIEDVVVWCGRNGYPAFDLENHDMECNALSEISSGDYVIEVIGNIHDNKELLEIE